MPDDTLRDRHAPDPNPASGRRRTALAAIATAALSSGASLARGLERPARTDAPTDGADRRGHDAALRMRALAESWGDQPYGAVIVAGGRVVGEGPSRVVRDGDADAHAERVAIRDARSRLGTTSLAGATLYSTSRPCPACESAAARAGVARMVFGASLVDAGRPVDRSR